MSSISQFHKPAPQGPPLSILILKENAQAFKEQRREVFFVLPYLLPTSLHFDHSIFLHIIFK